MFLHASYLKKNGNGFPWKENINYNNEMKSWTL